MTSRSHLVVEHLENVSGKVFDAYPEIIREMIKGKSGVYALYRRGSLYYVGLASNLSGRLKNHRRDRHSGLWDRFSVYLTVRDEHMKELESLLLRIVDPKGNRVKGGFARSNDLISLLNKEMKNADADRRADLVGGSVRKRRRRRKTRSGKGIVALSGIVARSTEIHGTYKGQLYKGRLRADGQISYQGQLYASPTGAAKAASGPRTVSGWRFWRLKNEGGDWVPLRQLRK